MSFAFDSMHDFIYMGHHGVYVWSAWIIALIALALLVFQSRVARQRFFREELTKAKLQKARAKRLKQDSPE